MISSLLEFIQRFFQLFVWWTAIQPWESAIRVRLGKKRSRLAPGLHLKIPYVDLIYRNTTRCHYYCFGPITVTTADGHTLTLGGILGVSITDLDRLYDTLQHVDDAMKAMGAAAVAEFVQQHPLSLVGPAQIAVACRPDLSPFGLSVVHFAITTYARVRTYRLIQDYGDNFGSSMNTTEPRP